MNYLVNVLRILCRIGRKDAAATAPEMFAQQAVNGAQAGNTEAQLAAGKAALERNETTLALKLFAAALQSQHENADAHFGMGLAHFRRAEYEDAADCFQMAVHYRPQSAETHNLLGASALRLGDMQTALASLAMAVELDPDNALFQSDLGYVLLRDCGEYERGSAHLKTALKLDAGNLTIRCNYCLVLWHEGLLDELIALCDDLLRSDPAGHEARLNRALALLKQGRYGEAWPDYEARKLTRSNFLRRPYAATEWRGESLAGKTVLVCGEQGVGDEIMFASCYAELIKLAGGCVIECAPRLATLLRRSFPAAAVHGVAQPARSIDWFNNLGTVDYVVDAGSLPGFFRCRAADFLPQQAYLQVDAARVDYWRMRLNALGGGLKVGIAWRGGAVSTRRSMRSMALADLSPLLDLPGIRFVSLQHDASVAEVAAETDRIDTEMHHWPESLREFDETAALIAALDLVVTVCTATVHLAGALGRRTWVLVPAIAEWRYLEQGQSMPWYSSVRMFRQAQAGNWAPVIAEVAAELAAVRDTQSARAPAEAHFAAGRFAEARTAYESLHAQAPDDPDVLYRLGVIYGGAGLLDRADALLERAAMARPRAVEVLNARANVAWLKSAWSRAEELFREAAALDSRNATVLANLGLCLHDAGRLDDALEVLRRALEIDSVHVDALVNAALVRSDLGELDGAVSLLRRALDVAPDFAEAHALHAQLLLRSGDFANGWREYEWRRRCDGARYREDMVLPEWNGEKDRARSLMIYAEQGLGDQIMFASCLPDALARISNCDLECDPRLAALFARSFPGARVHAQAADLNRPWAVERPQSASQIHIGSLPRLFRNGLADFPAHDGYLKPDAAKCTFWSAQLATLGRGVKAGIVWRGGVPRTRQAMRTIALPQWLPLLRTQGVHFVSLQHDNCDDEIREINSHGDVRLTHWPQAFDDCDETAALIDALDIVISVCGTAVHLAGAIGKTVWVMVPVCPEWRYMGSGDSMPWYPAARLFRQTARGDWGRPFADVMQLLSAAVPSHNGSGDFK